MIHQMKHGAYRTTPGNDPPPGTGNPAHRTRDRISVQQRLRVKAQKYLRTGLMKSRVWTKGILSLKHRGG